MPSRKRSTVRFQHTPLYRRREPHALHFIARRSSFWIATISLFAFVTGNMVGQHGIYAFWRSVLGNDQTVAFEGFGLPLREVVDYDCWMRYGGDYRVHTFRQAPTQCVVSYDPALHTSLLSVQHAGGYTDDVGSHPGVDIRVPEGTPVYAAASGVVEEVKVDPYGFGKVLVIRHPNAPDAAVPGATTTLYSVYAHLSSFLVEVGDTVRKGSKIGLSGQTGFASGPHLHWQLDNAAAPWHPYWPFSTAEMNAAGLSLSRAVDEGLDRDRLDLYTLDPFAYAGRNGTAVTLVATADDRPTPRVVSRPSAPVRLTADRLTSLVEARARERASRRATTVVAVAPPAPTIVATESRPTVVARETVVSADIAPIPTTLPATEVTSIDIQHDGTFTGRTWETIRISLLGSDGTTAVHPQFRDKVYLLTAFGSAEFKPAILQPQDFVNGEATVEMLPRGRRTVVIQVQPFGSLAKPMVYGE